MVHTINKRIGRVSHDNQRDERKENKVVSEHLHESPKSSSSKQNKESTETIRKEDFGPIKVAITHYFRSCKTSESIDYQPQICKDYHQTGSCGYGDTCKHAHIREKCEVSKTESNHLQKHRKIVVQKF